MSSSYLICLPGAVHVTNADGTVTLVPGVPVTALAAPQAAVLPSFFTDADSILTPAIGAPAASALLPALVDDADETIYTGVIATVGTPAQSLLPPFLTDEDAIHAPAVVPGSRTLA